MGTTVLAMPIWRGALLLACAVVLTCASAESAYPEVNELNEMGEGSLATAEGRSLADPSKEDKVKAAKSILEAVAKQNVKAEQAKMQEKVDKEKEEVKEEKKALEKAQEAVRKEKKEVKEEKKEGEKKQEKKDQKGEAE